MGLWIVFLLVFPACIVFADVDVNSDCVGVSVPGTTTKDCVGVSVPGTYSKDCIGVSVHGTTTNGGPFVLLVVFPTTDCFLVWITSCLG